MTYATDLFQDTTKIDTWYAGLLNGWNKLTLDKEHETVVLFLDNTHNIIRHFHLKPDVGMDKALEFAKNENATAICVGKNAVQGEELKFDKDTKKMVSEFKKSADKVGIPLRDFLIINRTGYSSAAGNNLL